MKPVILMLLLSVLTNTISQLSLKHGIRELDRTHRHNLVHPASLLSILTNPFVIIWAVLLVPSMFLWLKAISMTELSFAYPFLSLNLVFISLGSIVFLKERITAWQWIGIAMILSGIIVISRS